MRCAQVLGAAAALLTAITTASPTVKTHELSIRKGGYETGGAQIVELAFLIKDLIEDKHNAYEPNLGNQMCNLMMKTTDGSNCAVSILCAGEKWGTQDETQQFQGDKLWLAGNEGASSTGFLTDWNACFLNGIQYFHSDGLGDFSIQFTRAGGKGGDTTDGLHTPILRAAYIDNWTNMYPQEDSDKDGEYGHICKFTKGCGTGPQSHDLCWHCAIPALGHQYEGLSNNPGVTATKFEGGTCGIHFIDYQIPKGDNTYYAAVAIKDNTGAVVAQVGNAASVGNDRQAVRDPIKLQSNLLPQLFTYTRAQPGSSKSPDGAPIIFDYNGQRWTSDQNGCKVGKFDKGARQGDCSFKC